MRFSSLAIPFALNSVLSIVWMGSLARMDIGIETILSITSGMLVSGFGRIISVLTSTDTILFLILCPLTFAIIGIFSALAKDKKEAMAVGFAGATPIITGALYFSNLTYALTALFLVGGSVISALITFGHARNFKTIPAYGTGSEIMKKATVFIAIGVFLATYLSITYNYDSYKGILKESMTGSLANITGSLIPGGGNPQEMFKEQLKSPQYKEAYINTMGSMMTSMFSLMSQDSVVSPIVNSSLDRGALITVISLSGGLNDSPSAIVDVLLPLMRERTKNEITNYFRTSGEALSDHLKEQTEADYDNIIETMVGGSNNTSIGTEVSGVIDNLLESGPLGGTLRDALPIGLAFLMFSLITLVGSVFLSPLSGIYSTLLLKRVEKLVSPPVPEKKEAKSFADEIKKELNS